jgi:hypothetical protein
MAWGIQSDRDRWPDHRSARRLRRRHGRRWRYGGGRRFSRCGFGRLLRPARRRNRHRGLRTRQLTRGVTVAHGDGRRRRRSACRHQARYAGARRQWRRRDGPLAHPDGRRGRCGRAGQRGRSTRRRLDCRGRRGSHLDRPLGQAALVFGRRSLRARARRPARYRGRGPAWGWPLPHLPDGGDPRHEQQDDQAAGRGTPRADGRARSTGRSAYRHHRRSTTSAKTVRPGTG